MTQEQINKILKANNFEFIGEHHPRIKQVKNLVNNNKPNPEKLFIAEGIWSHRKLVEFNSVVKSLVVCPEYIHTPEAVALLEKMIIKTEFRFAVSAKTFEKISERDKPDGLLAVAVLPQHNLADFKINDKSIILVLDGIEIPGNIGTMLRMCDGAGVDGVFICNRKARLSHPKLIKGSMGAILSVPIFEFETIEDCYTWLKNNGFKIFLTDTRATHHYYDEPFNCKTAIVMGSERYGISREWYKDDVILLSIPMLGACDSLNVGVAATVVVYEATIKNKLNGRKKPLL
jgi:TrmH family RNA methyltransferase